MFVPEVEDIGIHDEINDDHKDQCPDLALHGIGTMDDIDHDKDDDPGVGHPADQGDHDTDSHFNRDLEQPQLFFLQIQPEQQEKRPVKDKNGNDKACAFQRQDRY